MSVEIPESEHRVSVKDTLDTVDFILNTCGLLYRPSESGKVYQWKEEGAPVWVDATSTRSYQRYDCVLPMIGVIECTIIEVVEDGESRVKLSKNFGYDTVKELDNDPFARHVMSKLDEYCKGGYEVVPPSRRTVVNSAVPDHIARITLPGTISL